MQVVYHASVVFIANQPYLYPTEKRCTVCLKFKSFEAFHNNKGSQDGMKPACKECRKDPGLRSFTANTSTNSGTKFCTKCLKEKSYDEFDKGKDQKDGYKTHCKECRSEHNQQFRVENIEKFREYDRSRIGNPERVARLRERRQTVYAIDGRYAETIKKNQQRWYQNNKIVAKEQCLRRQARQRGATVSKVNLERVLERDGYHCHICNASIDPTIKKGPASLVFDHIVPIQPRPGEPQGTHSEENITPAHRACNLRKSNLPLEALTPFLRRGV